MGQDGPEEIDQSMHLTGAEGVTCYFERYYKIAIVFRVLLLRLI